MQPDEIDLIRHTLPAEIPVHYYADRESPWLLAQLLTGDARIADLRAGPCVKFLSRPLVRAVTARSGDGWLRQLDLLAAGHAARAWGMPGVSGAGRAAVQQAHAAPWRDYVVTLDRWGTGRDNWRWEQMSRPGGNLVVQLGFPSDHAALFGRFMGSGDRSRFESEDHPIRTKGRPTLAWARLDIDVGAGIALIEEVQSDWIRFVEDELDWLEAARPRTRELWNLRDYRRGLAERYGREWSRVLMLAVLLVLRDEIGIHRVFMHRPGTGEVLKYCGGAPVSHYIRLPAAFGFRPTAEAPAFLARIRRADLGRLRRGGGPIFWELRFGSDGAA